MRASCILSSDMGAAFFFMNPSRTGVEDPEVCGAAAVGGIIDGAFKVGGIIDCCCGAFAVGGICPCWLAAVWP